MPRSFDHSRGGGNVLLFDGPEGEGRVEARHAQDGPAQADGGPTYRRRPNPMLTLSSIEIAVKVNETLTLFQNFGSARTSR